MVADNITIGTNTYSNDPTNTTFGGTGYSVTAPPIYDAGYATYYSTALNSSNPDYISSTLGYIDPKLTGRAPEFTAWSFGFQRSITRNMTATVSYVGNEGHHLTANYGASAERGYYNDALDPKWLALGACLGQTPTGSASTKAGSCASSGATVMANNGISLPYSSFPTSQKFSQMLLPFPQYKGVTDEFGSVSNSNYNSLQTTLEQRLSNGLTFMFNYTFSKSIDNAGTFRAGYAIPAIASSDGKAYAYGKADRSLSSFDQRHAINATATYDLPFGRGHIGGDNNLVRALAGGWRLSGIYTFIGGGQLQEPPPPPQPPDHAAEPVVHGPAPLGAPLVQLAHGPAHRRQRGHRLPDRDHPQQRHLPDGLRLPAEAGVGVGGQGPARLRGRVQGPRPHPARLARQIFHSVKAPHRMTSVQAGEVEAVHALTTDKCGSSRGWWSRASPTS